MAHNIMSKSGCCWNKFKCVYGKKKTLRLLMCSIWQVFHLFMCFIYQSQCILLSTISLSSIDLALFHSTFTFLIAMWHHDISISMCESEKEIKILKINKVQVFFYNRTWSLFFASFIIIFLTFDLWHSIWTERLQCMVVCDVRKKWVSLQELWASRPIFSSSFSSSSSREFS